MSRRLFPGRHHEMHILFDLTATQPVDSVIYHGGSEYAQRVLERLLALLDGGEVSLFFDPTRSIPPRVAELIEQHSVPTLPVRSPRDIQNLLDSGAFTLFYSSQPYACHDVDFSKTDVVFTVHGLRFIELGTDRYEYVFRTSLKDKAKSVLKQLFRSRYVEREHRRYGQLLSTPVRSRKIVVVSHHTKYALLNSYPWLSPDELRVAYSPRRPGTEPNPALLDGLELAPRSYFLVLCADRWDKNPFRAAKAIDRVFDRLPDVPKLAVFTGTRDEGMYRRALANADRFRFLEYLPYDDLSALYENAFCLIYPTLNEGFGYPPLESMACGTPVIASAITSVTEVCRDGAVYFNPYSIDELSNRILYLLHDPEAWKHYSERGREVAAMVAEQQDTMLDNLIALLVSDRAAA